MKIAKTVRRFVAWLCLVAILPSGGALAQDETVAVNAFAVVQGSGSAAKLGEKGAMMIGNFDGPFFVETDDGPIQAGRVVCLASVKVDLESTLQIASGACTFNAADGATAWGEFDCAGLNLIGCRGAFKLAGGTGRLAGATGEATLIWRLDRYSDLKNQLVGAAVAKTTGILSWRDFKLKEKPMAAK